MAGFNDKKNETLYCMYKLVTSPQDSRGATVTNHTCRRKKNAADGQAKSVNDGKKWMCMNLNEKSVLNGWEMAFCLLKQYRTIGAFIQYGPFVYSAFIIATRPEILDCSGHALPSNEQRCVFLPVTF